MKIELNYVTNEGDIQNFSENYYEFSLNAKKRKKWSLILALIIALIAAFPIHKLFEDGILSYLLSFIILLIGYSIYMVKDNRKDTIKSINKRHTSKDLGVLGEHKALLSDDELHITYLPNDPKRQRNMTNKWDEFDYYNRDEEHFLIYIDKSDLTFHIKAGEKADDVDQFLKRKGLNKKQQKD